MYKILKQLEIMLQAAKGSPIIILAVGISAVYHFIQKALEPIKNPIAQDFLYLLFPFFVVYLVLQHYLERFWKEKYFAGRLRENNVLYAIRATGVHLVMSLLVCFSVLYISKDTISQIIKYLSPPYSDSTLCIRVALACRECVTLFDGKGRTVGPDCLNLQNGGLHLSKHPRWLGYYPEQISMICEKNDLKIEVSDIKGDGECTPVP